VRDHGFSDELKRHLGEMVSEGSRQIAEDDWRVRPRLYKAAIWIAYGIVRVAMGFLGYGGNEWFRGTVKR
jgi:hypothetical protein